MFAGILKNAPPLPQDFFDVKEEKPIIQKCDKVVEDDQTAIKSDNVTKAEETLPMEVQTFIDPDLPEGFFDDPVLDAKVNISLILYLIIELLLISINIVVLKIHVIVECEVLSKVRKES